MTMLLKSYVTPPPQVDVLDPAFVVSKTRLWLTYQSYTGTTVSIPSTPIIDTLDKEYTLGTSSIQLQIQKDSGGWNLSYLFINISIQPEVSFPSWPTVSLQFEADSRDVTKQFDMGEYYFNVRIDTGTRMSSNPLYLSVYPPVVYITKK